ncbi:MAG: lysophospholipid acyltransferase family protein [Sandaracinaceae bacterium]
MDPLGTLRAVRRGLGFAAWTAGVVNAHRVCRRFDDTLAHHRGKQAFVDVWAKGVFPILGVDFTHVGGSLPHDLGPFLVISNHRSPLDILIAQHMVGGVVLAHQGVADIPVIGDAAAYTDTVFVDREDSKSGAKAIRQLRRRLREGRNVVVFPEGTTFAGDEVRPFKRGAFTAAKGLAHVRVLPIGLAYRPGDEFADESFGDYSSRMSRGASTPVWATLGEPADVPRTADDEAKLRDVVQALVDRSVAARHAS